MSTSSQLVLLALLLSAVSTPVAAADLLIAAAADLASLQQPLTEAFRKATGHSARFTLGSSGMLARQIRNGAPYDLYLSANERFVNELSAAGHVLPESVLLYGHGRLALWSPDGTIRALQDLDAQRVRHISIANPAHAPYGVAAQQSLESAGLYQRLRSRLVLGENVRQAFEYARSGNADATLTAWTLVFDKGGVLVPASAHAPIRQVGAVVKGSPRTAEAKLFLQFLASKEGRQLLARYGLSTPD